MHCSISYDQNGVAKETWIDDDGNVVQPAANEQATVAAEPSMESAELTE